MPLLQLALLALASLSLHAADRVPERRELWVPAKNIENVLKQHPNAVLLDREQYDALIRDAGRMKPDAADQPPVGAVIEGVKMDVSLTRGDAFAKLTAKITIRHLTDGWVQSSLLQIPASVQTFKVDGMQAGVWNNTEYKLALRGLGRHEVIFEFQAPVVRSNGFCRARIPMLARPFSMTITPHGDIKLPERWPLHDGVAVPPIAGEIQNGNEFDLAWEESATDGNNNAADLRETANITTRIDGVQMLTDARIDVTSSNGSIPAELRFALPDENTHVISVNDSGVAAWKQNGAVLEITRATGVTARRSFRVVLSRPAPDGTGDGLLLVDVPRLIGAARIETNIALGTGEGYEMKGWQTPAANASDAFQTELTKSGFIINSTAHYDVAPEKIIGIVRRTGDHFSADVDAHIALSTHEMTTIRTVALHGEEGRVNRTTLTLPANEQFIALAASGGEAFAWKQIESSKGILPLNDAGRGQDAPATFEITWPGGLKKGGVTTLQLKTRQDISAKANSGQGSEKLTVENVLIADATRIAGYVALDFDESWKVATQDTAGMESRDARSTPVTGKMAWFTLRDFKLALDIARNDPVLDAVVVAHALPRAKQVEIEGQFTLNVSRAPLRKFDVQLPVATAKLLHVDSPQVGEQSLDEATGIWHFSLRRELLGTANIRFHLSLPANISQDSALGTLTSVLPQFGLPNARRFSGQWVIEANTDTELTYATKGAQPVDALNAPAVEGYQPRHRVLAAFSYTAAAHEVKLTATRHEPSALIGAVVAQMNLTSVLSADGSSRHQADMMVQHNGQQYFAVRLPKGAQLLAAMAANEAVKPVRGGDDEVRIPLNSGSSESSAVPVKVIYELGAAPWGSSGKHRLEPPTVGDGVPVLSSTWRVYAPDGMEIRTKGGFGEQGENGKPVTLLGAVTRFADMTIQNRDVRTSGNRSSSATMLYESVDEMIMISPKYPKPMFMGTPVPVLSNGKPMTESERQIAIAESYLVAGKYSEAKNQLNARLKVEPADQAAAKLLAQINDSSRYQDALTSEHAGSLPMIGDISITGRLFKTPSSKSGLISLDLTLPTTGRILNFSGHQKPESLTLTYQTWARQMSKAVGWMLLGMMAFFFFGWRRPCVRTFLAALLLTCVPLLLAMSWLPVCNAFLAGWLSMFLIRLLWRIARWMEIKGAWLGAKCRSLIAPRAATGVSGWLLISALTTLALNHAQADEVKPDPAAHSVIVPYDGSKPLNGQQATRFYLDYADFQRLWELAKENRRPAKPDDLDQGLKPEAAINSALYEAEVFEDRLHVNARLQVVTRGGKWAKLPLSFEQNGLSISEVKLDGKTAAVNDGGILIEETGPHVVEVVLDVRQPKGWQNMTFAMPQSAASVFSMTVPVTDGRPLFIMDASLVTEETKNGRQVFTVPLGAAASVTFQRSAYHRPAGDALPLSAESNVTLSIQPSLETFTANVLFKFPGTERDRFTLLLDPDLKPVLWKIENLRDWTLKNENGKLRADIRLLHPVAEFFSIAVTAERVLPAVEGTRSAPQIEGVATKQSSVFNFQFSNELKGNVQASGAVQRMEGAALASNGMTGGGAYRMQKDGKLGYTVALAEDRGSSRSESVFQISPQKAEIIAAITLDTGREPLRDALIGVPPGFEVQTLAGPRVLTWDREGDNVFVRFDAQPQREARLVLHVARTLAKADATWKLEPLKFPQFKKHEGTVLIATHTADDVKLEFDSTDRKIQEADPATITAVVTVAPPLAIKRALKVEKAGWNATVTLTRQTPKFAVDAVLLAQATDEGLKFSQQVGVLIEQGALNRVTLRMPKDLPEARVLGALVRDAQSKIIGDVREYEVTFQTEVLDRVDFSLDFELPIEGEKVLPVLQMPDASRMQKFFIVDNASSREMKTNAGGSVTAVKDSLPYVPDGLSRPVFFRADEKSSVKLVFTQLESSTGNAAIVTLAEITSALRPNGERMETVVYSLANRSLQFLPVRLPAGAELIEVSVGGQSVRADRAKSASLKADSARQEYLVPLIQMRPGELSQQVRLVYRLPAGASNLEARQTMDDPELIGLSAERTLWNVWLPRKFVMKKWDGNMEEVPEVVVEDEKQMQKVSDAARLNRLLLSSNLEERDAKEAWGNANKALDEVKQYQAKKRSAPSSRTKSDYDGDDGKNSKQREQQALKYEGELEKQADTQDRLLTENRVKFQNPTKGKPQMQADPKGGKDSNATWNGQAGGQTVVTNGNFANPSLNVNNGGVVAFNDNVQVDQGFLAQQDQGITKAGAGTLTGTGANTYTGSTSISGGVLQTPAKPNAKPNEAAPQQQTIINSNSRAYKGVNPQGAASIEGLDLNREPEVTALNGFINYGAPIQSAATSSPADAAQKLPLPLNPGATRLLNEGDKNDSLGGGFLPRNDGPLDGVSIQKAFPVTPSTPTSVTTKSGQRAKTEVVREFVYPSEFNPPQLKPVGRVSLAVEVPLEGKVYHFRKLKDHALIEMDVKQPLSARQASALWLLVAGGVVLIGIEAITRWRKKRKTRLA